MCKPLNNTNTNIQKPDEAELQNLEARTKYSTKLLSPFLCIDDIKAFFIILVFALSVSAIDFSISFYFF